MYFWNVRELKQELTRGPLTQAESFKYFMPYIVCASLRIRRSDQSPDPWYLLYVLMNLVIVVAGMLYCYRRNGGAQGQYFLQRYFSIGLVMALRWSFMVFLPFMIVTGNLVKGELLAVNSLWVGVGFRIIMAVWYWRVAEHIHEVATGQCLANPVQSTAARGAASGGCS